MLLLIGLAAGVVIGWLLHSLLHTHPLCVCDGGP